MADELPDYGELDGERIALVVVKVSGGGLLERRPEEGERALLVVEGHFGSPVVKRVDGVLVREHTVKVAKLGEAAEDLAEEADRFLQELQDRRENRQQLPFPEDDDPEAGTE